MSREHVAVHRGGQPTVGLLLEKIAVVHAGIENGLQPARGVLERESPFREDVVVRDPANASRTNDGP